MLIKLCHFVTHTAIILSSAMLCLPSQIRMLFEYHAVNKLRRRLKNVM